MKMTKNLQGKFTSGYVGAIKTLPDKKLRKLRATI
jgi:hypothetical protein